MAIKICSFKEVEGVPFPEFTKEDPSNVVQLGMINNKFFFSFDDEKASISGQDENEIKVYDFSVEDDVAEIKESLSSLNYVLSKIFEMDEIFFSVNSRFKLIKGIRNSDESVLDLIDAHDTARTEFLQSVGLPANILD